MIVEAEIAQYLTDVLPYPIYGERPDEPPQRYYLMEKVGGHRSNGLFYSAITVQSIVKASSETSLFDAAAMNDTLLRAVFDDNGGLLLCPDITRAELNGNSNYTDPESGEYKYQALFDIYHY